MGTYPLHDSDFKKIEWFLNGTPYSIERITRISWTKWYHFLNNLDQRIQRIWDDSHLNTSKKNKTDKHVMFFESIYDIIFILI